MKGSTHPLSNMSGPSFPPNNLPQAYQGGGPLGPNWLQGMPPQQLGQGLPQQQCGQGDPGQQQHQKNLQGGSQSSYIGQWGPYGYSQYCGPILGSYVPPQQNWGVLGPQCTPSSQWGVGIGLQYARGSTLPKSTLTLE